MQKVSFLVTKFKYIHLLFQMLGTVWGASLGVCWVGVLCPLGLLTCCSTWVRWLVARITGRKTPHGPCGFQESGLSFQYGMPTFSSENRGHNLLRVGEQQEGLAILYQAQGEDLYTSSAQSQSSMTACRMNKWIHEAVRMKKQNKTLRYGVKLCIWENTCYASFINPRLGASLVLSFAGELKRF